MKYIYLVLAVLLLASCANHAIEISGTAKNMDGGAVSILDTTNKTLYSTIIKAGKFSFGQQAVDPVGYYTFSVMSGKYPHDFDIYLEPGKYTITIPEKDGDYLKINTSSKIQNDLSAYYNFEDSIMYSFRHKLDTLTAQLSDPKTKVLPAADFSKLLADFNSAKLRVQGAESAVMGMFVDKYPKNDIVIHVLSSQNLQDNPDGYFIVYQKLSPTARNSEEGKHVGEKLSQLLNHQK